MENGDFYFGIQYDPVYKAKVLDEYCPDFWDHFPTWDDASSSLQVSQNVVESFKKFYECIMSHASNGTLSRQDLMLARAALLLEETKASKQFMIEYFTLTFKCHKNALSLQSEDLDDDAENDSCDICLEEATSCCCGDIISHFKELNGYLRSLGLLQYIASPSVAAVVYNQTKEYLELLCKDEFQKHYLEDGMNWAEKMLLSWLKLVVGQQTDGFKIDNDDFMSVETWRPKLEYFLCKVYAELRILQLFEIIVEFPESLPAIEDLKECLEKTETRKLLTSSLKEAFTNRLLQPAVNTSDILTQYISTIRALRALEPSGVILENVCQPLREYLRTRDDTIRCIITNLTDQDSGTDLSEELIASEPIPVDVVDHSDSESDGEDWMPEAVDANIDFSSKGQRMADIISMLVNIYGSKDLFVSEYRSLLADRILSSFSYDVSNERRYLELLKRRFGESHLHFCDTMLKDVQDSQRMNRHIKDKLAEKLDDAVDVNALILSAVYWPPFKDDQVTLPDSVKSVMESYTKEFETLKGMRTLNWLEALGDVELDIELEDGSKTFNVNPVQATIIMLFEEKECWEISELCSELDISANAVRTRIGYWMSQGVIIERSSDTFQAATSYSSVVKETSFYEVDDDSLASSAQNQRDEELQTYWSYVVGMLTNIGTLPLERIHSMLKMFAVTGPAGSQCTADDVKQFLDAKVKAGELQFSNGLYKLSKT